MKSLPHDDDGQDTPSQPSRFAVFFLSGLFLCVKQIHCFHFVELCFLNTNSHALMACSRNREHLNLCWLFEDSCPPLGCSTRRKFNIWSRGWGNKLQVSLWSVVNKKHYWREKGGGYQEPIKPSILFEENFLIHLNPLLIVIHLLFFGICTREEEILLVDGIEVEGNLQSINHTINQIIINFLCVDKQLFNNNLRCRFLSHPRKTTSADDDI